MHLDLSADEARFLREHLQAHIGDVEDELIHTDRRAMQRELARDIDHLRSIERRLAALVPPTP
jgi:hypothetical protein